MRRELGDGYLNTRGAHQLYERFGFEPADPGHTMTRPRGTS
jgi:predicted N-acetyltransferase YhbS